MTVLVITSGWGKRRRDQHMQGSSPVSFHLHSDCIRWGLFPLWLMWKLELRKSRWFLQSLLADKWLQSLCLFLSTVLFSRMRKSKQNYKASRPRWEWSSIILSVSPQGLVRMSTVTSHVPGVTVGAAEENCVVLAGPSRVLTNKAITSAMAKLRSILSITA